MANRAIPWKLPKNSLVFHVILMDQYLAKHFRNVRGMDIEKLPPASENCWKILLQFRIDH